MIQISSAAELPVEPVYRRQSGATALAWDQTVSRAVAPAGELTVRIELGRTHLPWQQMMAARWGDLITLDAPEEGGVDIYVGDRLVARGEPLVHEGKYCVRITKIISIS